MNPPADYQAMTPEQALVLKGVVTLPQDVRRILLRQFAETHGQERLADLFAAFIGLANSVVENNRECIELFGLLNGEHPHTVEQYNLPTIFGALNGVSLAATVSRQRGLCHGCAYRLGTPANQSPITTEDAEYVFQCCGHEQFWCHEHVDENGKPTRVCGGHKQRTRKREGQEREREANV